MKDLKPLKKCSILLFFCWFPALLFAQKQDDYKWKTALEAPHEVLAEYVDSKAVVLEQTMVRECYFRYSKFQFKETRKRRLKIQDAAVLEQCRKIRFPYQDNLSISRIAARVLKSSGELIHFSPNDIRPLPFGEEASSSSGLLEQIYSLPGLEVGDILEWVVIREGRQVDPGGNVFFHAEFPVIQSTFTLALSLDIEVLFQAYNDLPKIETTFHLDKKRLSWTARDLPAIRDERGAIPALTLPYLAYNLELYKLYPDNAFPSNMTWLDLLESIYYKDLSLKNRKPNWMAAWYAKRLEGKEESSILEQLKCLHDWSNQQLKFQSVANTEINRSLSYFLEQQQVNYLILLKLYKDMLERMGVDFYLGVAKNRYDGALDLKFPAHTQVQELFYLFLDENDEPHFLFPKTKDAVYDLDRVPFELEGTEAFLYKPDDAEHLGKLRLPYSQPSSNQIRRNINVLVNTEEKQLTFYSKLLYKGGFGPIHRAHYQKWDDAGRLFALMAHEVKQKQGGELLKSELVLKDETLNNSDFYLNYQWTTKQPISLVEEGVFRIKIKDWLVHVLPERMEKDRKLDYFPLFTSVDAYTYTLDFDQPISLLNEAEDCAKSVKTPSGEWHFSLQQVSPKRIVLESKFALLSNQIAVEHLENLEILKQGILEGEGMDVLVELE